MAIQLLKHSIFLALMVGLVGCEKWADGVVREIDFPEHTPQLAATVNLFAGDTKAIAALHQTASTLDANDAVIPEAPWRLDSTMIRYFIFINLFITLRDMLGVNTLPFFSVNTFGLIKNPLKTH